MKLYLSSFRLGNNPEKFAELFGENKKVIVIMNAIDFNDTEMRKEKFEREVASLTEIGLEPEELDLRDYFGKKDKLSKKLKEYAGVWVRGGNVFVLMRAFLASGFDEIVKEKIKNKEFVYGGYSAGVCVLCIDFKGVDLMDNPNIIPKGYDVKIPWKGVGLLPYRLVPHYKSEHPEAPSAESVVAYLEEHKLSYKTLRDGEVIVQDM